MQPTSVTTDSANGIGSAPRGDVSQYLASLFSAVSPEPLYEVCTSSAWASYSAWRSSKGEGNHDNRATITEMPKATARALPAFTYSPASPCCGSCFVSAGPVQLVHWPTPAIDPGVTAITSGTFTFTSPTQYIIFTSLFASNACGTQGSPVGLATLGFSPGQLSSILHWVPTAGTTTSDITTMINFADLGTSCAKMVDAGTSLDIYKTTNGNVYRDRMCYPDIDIPPAAVALNTEWATCTGLKHGAYDPPIILMTESALLPNPAPSPSLTLAPPAVTSTAATTHVPVPPSPLSAPPSPAVSSSASVNNPPTSSSEPSASNQDQDQSNQKPSQSNSGSSTPNQVSSQPNMGSSGQASNPGPNGPNRPPAPTGSIIPPKSQSTAGIGNIILTALGGKLPPSHNTEMGSGSEQAVPTPITVSMPTPTEKSRGSVVAAGQTLVVPSPSKVIVGQKTLSAGGAAATASGIIFSINAAGSLVAIPTPTTGLDHNGQAQSNGNNINSGLPASPTTMTVNGQVITASPSGIVVDGSTILPGGRPLDVGGIQISVATDGAIIAGSSTATPAAGTVTGSIVPFKSFAPSLQTFSLGEAVVTAGPSTAFFDGKTLTAGGPAGTVNGTLVSVAADGALIMGTSTTTLSAELAGNSYPANVAFVPTTMTVKDKTFTVGPSNIAVAGTTLEAGGPAATISGTLVSIGTNGIIVVGNTTATANISVFQGATNKLLPSKRGLLAIPMALALRWLRS